MGRRRRPLLPPRGGRQGADAASPESEARISVAERWRPGARQRQSARTVLRPAVPHRDARRQPGSHHVHRRRPRSMGAPCAREGGDAMIYADYLSTAEIQRWNIDTDVDWDDIDPQLA